MELQFKDREREKLVQGRAFKRIPRALMRRIQRKVRLLNAANEIRDLRHPPGNRLERLRGDRAGQFSIRVNEQFRICFRLDEETHRIYDIEFVDYHP